MDIDWQNETRELRIETIRETIRKATVEEISQLATEYFEVVSDPWYEKYNQWIKKHKAHAFYRADTPEGAVVVYSREANQGYWILPESAIGILQAGGLEVMAAIVDDL